MVISKALSLFDLGMKIEGKRNELCCAVSGFIS